MKRSQDDNLPGLQVPPLVRVLWLGIPTIVLLLSIPLQLVPLLDEAHAATPTLSPIARNEVPNPPVIEEEGGAAEFCSLKDVLCEDENPLTLTQPVISERPQRSENHFVDTSKMVTLMAVCARHGLGEQCAKDLLGMHYQETGYGKQYVGDRGRSGGAFHILWSHGLTKECSYDLACSADWSLKRMIKYGYKTNRAWGIGSHNSLTPQHNRNYYAAVQAKVNALQ